MKTFEVVEIGPIGGTFSSSSIRVYRVDAESFPGAVVKAVGEKGLDWIDSPVLSREVFVGSDGAVYVVGEVQS